MGGDGGCIATQREFMRGTYGSSHKAKGWAGGQNHGAGCTGGDEEKGDFRVRRKAIQVRSCALTSQTLAAPVVADELGNLFNKLPLLEALSAKAVPERFSYVRGLRDLVDCKFAPVKESTYLNGEGAALCACPVGGEPLDGSKPFVVSRTSGWILGEKCVTEMGVDALQAEYGPFTASDLVRVCPADDELKSLADAMLARRAEEKRRKKDDKKRKRAERAAAGGDAGDGDGRAAAKPKAPAPKPPPKKQASIGMSAAADVAKQARERTTQDHASAALQGLFHDESKTTAPKDLFIATAARRYNLN